jgi:phosphomannomutase
MASDPLVVWLRLMVYLQANGMALSDISKPERFPQEKRTLECDNLDVSSDQIIDYAHSHYAAIRWVIRPSGTEPVIRILGEHHDEAFLLEACDKVVAYASSGIV